MRDYTFDIVAVATFHIGAPDYATARRAAEGLMEFDVANNAVSEGVDDPPGLTYELTCVAPRGKASLVSAGDDDADMDDEEIPPGDYQTLAEPITDTPGGHHLTDEWYADAHVALDALNDAAEGDSNDEEIEAGRDVADMLEQILAWLGHPYPEQEN